MERLEALVDASIDRAHVIEAAIRTWSRSDERAAAAPSRRLADLVHRRHVRSVGGARDRERVRAEMGLSMLVGFQTRAGLVDRAVARAAAAEWRAVLRAVVQEAADASATR